jgi:hypothetical protein
MEMEESLKKKLLEACNRRLIDSVAEMDVDPGEDHPVQVFKF